MKRAIIFDLDGILVDTKILHYKALNSALLKLFGFEISIKDHIKTYDGLPTVKKLNILLNKGFILKEDFNKISKLKQEETLRELDKLIPEKRILDLFKFCRKSFEKIIIASNSVSNTVKKCIEKLEISEYIDLYLSNEDVEFPKPNPQIYLKAMITFGLEPQDCLILEDSIHGRKAALSSGGTLIPINFVNEVTIEKIIPYMSNNNEINNSWQDDKLNIVIPMAGNGSRFATAGYTFPKPLIDVNGKPMIQRVVESLNIKANYIYIVKKEHYEQYALQSLLNLITPNCKIIQLNETTDGAARTILKAKEFINNESPLILCNSDQIIKWDTSHTMYKFINSDLDSLILTFNSTHPKWSFVKLDDDLVTEVAEKKPISDIATVGIYLYKNGSDFVKYAEQMIDKNIRVNNEFYTCPVFNEMILDNKKIGISMVEEMHGVGTPEDLNQYFRNI